MLNKLLDFVKLLKTEYFCLLTNGVLIGTDADFTHMRELQTDIYDNTLFNKTTVLKDSLMDPSDSVLYDIMFLPDIRLNYNRLLDMYNNTKLEVANQYPHVVDDISIFSDKYFSIKAKDGAVPIMVDNHYFYIFSGMIPLAKSDKIQIVIFDNEQYYIIKYSIEKKKQHTTIDVYYKYLYI
jgi:hypothetical protein